MFHPTSPRRQPSQAGGEKSLPRHTDLRIPAAFLMSKQTTRSQNRADEKPLRTPGATLLCDLSQFLDRMRLRFTCRGSERRSSPKARMWLPCPRGPRVKLKACECVVSGVLTFWGSDKPDPAPH